MAFLQSHSLLFLLLLVLSLLCSLSSQTVLGAFGSTRIRNELGPLLSQGCNIIDEASGNLTEATRRWQLFASPNFDAVVQVNNEADIIQTIKYANKYSIPYLAFNTGHGEIKSLGNLRAGIQITIRGMSNITINGNNTATVQGGATNLDIVSTLWKANKQTVSGTCECVGFMGPVLGGGHGFLQGYHGMAADQLLEARVVLANGTVAIASRNQNADLFWALRGAGHNFGIVTEVTTKIYDVPKNDTWYYETFVYSGSSVEMLFTELNNLKGAPAAFEHYAVYLRLPDVDPSNAVVLFSILYHGLATDAEQYVAPFRKFNPLSDTNGTATYPQLAAITGNGINDDICQNENSNRIRYPVYLDRYDPKAQKAVFDNFNMTTARYPALNASLMLFEGLSTQAVAATPINSTAFPYRNYFALSSPVVTYAPNTSFDATAQNFGRSLRSTLYQTSNTSNLRAYVNYAVGEESLQNLYGSEPWRVTKLKGLKQTYDPQNRFRWYAPIGL
ncbi:FAD-binding domain-containing protein [Pleomassaria siparia CBS 279.74]|uniref:FAD-binding domain-containing protein n=1 Tax=Pleomassaria siparia CBS 279.74 TaxID=1314801 RepID=A0A6G1JYJ6_9PLEO|nr:FAD-binding domain-containing protein [Pleomassaria siparia CBS 279.74]